MVKQARLFRSSIRSILLALDIGDSCRQSLILICKILAIFVASKQSKNAKFNYKVVKINNFHVFQDCIACILYPICSIISIVFLLLTLLVYAMLPDLRKPLVGKVVMVFVAALFSAYLSLTIVTLGGLPLIQDLSGCQFLAFFVQVSLLPTLKAFLLNHFISV